MTQVQWHEPSGETEIPGKGTFRDHYAPGAFSSLIGQRVPFRSYPGGPQAGWATVIAVTVDDDGLGATWTADIGLGIREMIALAVRSGLSFRVPEDGSGPSVVRDPIASRPPVIRDSTRTVNKAAPDPESVDTGE